MKKGIFYLMILFSVIGFTSCHSVDVGAGEEAVIIAQPIFGHGGIFDSPETTGNSWIALTSTSQKYSILPVLYTENFTNMTTKDHNTVTFSAYLKIKVKKGESPNLHKNFGLNWYDANIKEVFRTLIRNKCSEHDMFDLTSDRIVLDTMQKAILAEVKEAAIKLNMPVDVLDLQIGQATPPDEVLKETHLTAAQNQNRLTQIARGASEDERAKADRKKALADLSYMNTMGMNIDQYQRQRSIEIEKEKVELIKDKDKVSISFISNSGVGVQPTYQTNK